MLIFLFILCWTMFGSFVVHFVRFTHWKFYDTKSKKFEIEYPDDVFLYILFGFFWPIVIFIAILFFMINQASKLSGKFNNLSKKKIFVLSRRGDD